jgi:signal transduction histidine kinase/DNA-binding NarL/FixJ family response regulator
MVIILTVWNPTDVNMNGAVVSLIVLLCNLLLVTFVTIMFMDIADSLTDATMAASARTKVAEAKAKFERDANAAKTRFVSVMSHELRHPLQATVLHVEMLQTTKLSETQATHLAGIATASTSLLSIIADILDVTKLTSGAISLDMRTVVLRELVENSVVATAALSGNTGVEVACCVAPSLQTSVITDARRIQQVLDVLLSNALKFTEEGEIEVTLARDEDVEDGWVLGVRDTGIGIDDDGQNKLFREFTQVDETSTRLYGGTGLGLFISKELLHLMNGSISVESEVGVGSTFTASFVAAPSEEAEETVPLLPSSNVKWTVVLHSVCESLRRLLDVYVTYLLSETSDVRIVHSNQVWTAQARLASLLRSQTSRGRLLLIADYADCSVGLLDALTSQSDGTCVPIMLTTQGAHTLPTDWPHVLHKPVLLRQLREVVHTVTAAGNKAMRPSSRPLGLAAGKPSLRSKKEGRATVLIVDDFEVVCSLVQQLVEAMGYHAIVATNGREAVDLVKAHYHDNLCLVLMDFEMPVLDGVSAAKEIRAWEEASGIEGGSRLPICAMTANDTAIVSAGSDVMTAVLTKPVRRQDLEAQLQAHARLPTDRGIPCEESPAKPARKSKRSRKSSRNPSINQ